MNATEHARLPLAPRADTDSRELAARIHACAPLRHPAFGSLLGLLSIEVSTEVRTAAVTLGSRSRLLVNPEFVAERCRTQEHLAMLVMHELYHLLLGHTRLYRRATPRQNWAFDCIINAQLCRLFPAPACTSFFQQGVPADGPFALLAPPPGWPRKPRYADGPLGAAHRRLYDSDAMTTEELFDLLDALAAEILPEHLDLLLGQHGADAEGGDPCSLHPDLLAEVRRLVARWPMVAQRGGRDDGGRCTEQQLDRARHPPLRRAVARLVARLAAGEGAGRPRSATRDVESLLPWAQAGDRRGRVLAAAGHAPLLWRVPLATESWQRAGQVTVYLDVSGSMRPYLPAALDGLLHHAGSVRWPLWAFSTEVHAATLAELRNGRVRSTGGTDLRCVARHLAQVRTRRALIVTDGDVGRVGGRDAETLRALRLGVVLCGATDAPDLAGLGATVACVPAL